MLERGVILAERYEILGLIGTGGMSHVYKAKDLSLNREVAVKVLKDEYVTDNAFVSKFRAEATSAASLEHPNIVNVYDVGNVDGRHFIVMEYVEGVTLKTYIAKKGHLSTNELLSVAIQVGRGIEAAHSKNIIHRDIKPQNVIISKDGKVKVTDFGIARAITNNTINADRMGSVHYSSPEQTRSGYVTFQSDIYSLGIVMYEMCTGEVPFDGDTTVAVALQHLQTEITPPSRIMEDVPISVEKIILRATMKTPERRYENITDMLTDLKKALISPDEDFVYIPPAVAAPNPIEELIERDVEKDKRKSERTDHTGKKERKRIIDPDDEIDDDEIEDSEEMVSRKMDKAVTIMGIAAAIVIVLIVIYLAGSFFGFFGFGRGSKVSTLSGSSVVLEKVPDVLDMTEEEAKKEIEKAGFLFQKIGEASSDEYEAGKVMEQDPKGKSEAALGSTVSVIISSGAGTIDVPKVTGMPQAQAMQLIEQSGFKSSIQTEYSSSVEQGKVTRQSPAEGSKANQGDIITIWISRGSELTSIPGVANYTQEQAIATLTNAGFNVNVTTQNSESVAAGRVIEQSQTGQAVKGTTVTIVVSLGPVAKTYTYVVTVPTDADPNPAIVELKGPNNENIKGAKLENADAGNTYKFYNVQYSNCIVLINGVQTQNYRIE